MNKLKIEKVILPISRANLEHAGYEEAVISVPKNAKIMWAGLDGRKIAVWVQYEVAEQLSKCVKIFIVASDIEFNEPEETFRHLNSIEAGPRPYVWHVFAQE